MIKQPAAPRKKRTSRPRAQYAVLPEGSVYTLEPVKEQEKESAAS